MQLKDPWLNRVAETLIDIVVGDGIQAIAVDCGPHPDGAAAHIDRALMLRRAGWRTADAYATKWSGDLGQLAIELSQML